MKKRRTGAVLAVKPHNNGLCDKCGPIGTGLLHADIIVLIYNIFNAVITHKCEAA